MTYRHSGRPAIFVLAVAFTAAGCAETVMPPVDEFAYSVTGRVIAVEADRKVPRVQLENVVWTPTEGYDRLGLMIGDETPVFFTQADGSVRKMKVADIPIGMEVVAWANHNTVFLTGPPLYNPDLVNVRYPPVPGG